MLSLGGSWAGAGLAVSHPLFFKKRCSKPQAGLALEGPKGGAWGAQAK